MSKNLTRSRIIQGWFAVVVVVIVASVLLGATMSISTGAVLLTLCLGPPTIVLMLWPREQPLTVAEVLRAPAEKNAS